MCKFFSVSMYSLAQEKIALLCIKRNGEKCSYWLQKYMSLELLSTSSLERVEGSGGPEEEEEI